MHFIIVGCGRVGSALAVGLEAAGHSVAVIDTNPESFRRLPADFSGQKVTGMGFDRATLEQAGVREAYGLAAVTSGDNSNVLAARVVRETFGIHNVVARIYDPDRAEVFQRLGISTVATVPWTTDQITRQLLPAGATDEYRDPSGKIALVHFDVNQGWIGHTVARLEEATQARVAFITRIGVGELVNTATVIQDRDAVQILVEVSRIGAVERVCARPPKEED